MDNLLKKRTRMAWVVLLTFLFTSLMPGNSLAGHGVAEAATDEVVAVIGETEFSSLQAAVDAAQSGDTIVLQKNVQESVISEQKSYTLNLNSHTVTAEDNDRVFTINGGEVTMQNGTITGGETTDNGGGLLIYRNTAVTLKNCIVSNNKAKNGGGIYADWDSIVVAEKLTIIDNTATNQGGGMYASKGNITIAGGMISGNKVAATTYANGGGLYLSVTDAALSDLTISGNKTENTSKVKSPSSATIHVTNGPIQLNRCHIVNNVSAGSTVYLSGSKATFANCSISNNIANLVGGVSLNFAAGTFQNSVVKNNWSTGIDGGSNGSSATGGIQISRALGGNYVSSFEMKDSAVYANIADTTNANDFYYSGGNGNKGTISAAGEMVDGEMSFGDYVWEDKDGQRTQSTLDLGMTGTYQYTAVDATSENVYLDGKNGDDTKDGLSPKTAVRTFARAKAIAENPPEGKNRTSIYIMRPVTISEKETWDLSNIGVYRYLKNGSLLVDIAEGGSLELGNIVLDGNLVNQGLSNNDSLIRVQKGGTLIVGEQAVLQNNDASHFTVHTAAQENWGGAIKNYGTVTVKGTIQNCSAFYGGGIYSGGGTINMEDGASIQYNTARLASNVLAQSTENLNVSGGGVMLTGGQLWMNGGTIANNKSYGAGGGIALGAREMAAGWSASLKMNGGAIDSNTALSQGGGLFVQCDNEAEIRFGSITNNFSNGNIYEGQFSGGGIYVNGGAASHEDGVLQLYNTVIADNTASSSGGGIAGCPTSTIGIYVTEGGAVYGNEAQSISGDDVYVISGKVGSHIGTASAHFSIEMLGGGLNRWMSDSNRGSDVPRELGMNEYYSVSQMNAKNTPSGEDIAKAGAQATVWITGNRSGTSGGGIGTNGIVQIGVPDDESIQLEFAKKWLDKDDADQARPDSIKVWVLRNGEKLGFVYLSNDKYSPWGAWKAKLSNLEKNDKDGVPYVYTWEEDKEDLEGYQSEIEHDPDGNITITNTRVVTINGTKYWLYTDGTVLPDEITVGLFCDDSGEAIATTTTSLSMNWNYSFGQYPKYAEDGHTYQYTVKEKMAGYDTYYEQDMLPDGQLVLNVTNVNKSPLLPINGEKLWFDARGTVHPAITVELWRTDATGQSTRLATREVSEQSGWRYDFGYQPKTDENGEAYSYQVVEANVPEGYISIPSGYDLHNVQSALYDMGHISLTKRVTNSPASDTAFAFNLYVKALHKIEGVLDEAQQRAKTLLAEAKLRAETNLQKAEQALYGVFDEAGNQTEPGAIDKFIDSAFLTNTSASSYQFFVTDGDDTAIKAVATGSALYVEHVSLALERKDASLWDGFDKALHQIVTIINDLADEFVQAVTNEKEAADSTEQEEPLATHVNRPTTAILLSNIAQQVEVASGSAIAFEESKLDNMFDAMVAHKQALHTYEDALAAWNAFASSITTPAAIVLIVNGDVQHPIELAPESGVLNTETGLLEFTAAVPDDQQTAQKITKIYYDPQEKQYMIPFELIKDETIQFSLKATTGSAVQYRIVESDTATLDANYVDTFIYNGSDLAQALETEAALRTDWADLTSGSAIGYVFDNQYNGNTTPGGSTPGTDPGRPSRPSSPDTPIDDSDVPLTRPDGDRPTEIDDPDVPLTDVPGETVELEEPPVPLGDAPETGDRAPIGLLVGMLFMAAGGLVTVRRKGNE